MKAKALNFDPTLQSYILATDSNHRYVITSNDVRYNLGDGSYGKVFKSKSLEDGTIYAIKQITKKLDIPECVIKEEILKLKEFIKYKQTPNITYSIDTAEDEKFYYIVMPFCDQGKLSDFIEQRKIQNEIEALEYFRQICYIVKILKDNGISAYFIDKHNILVQSSNTSKSVKYNVVLSDLGIIKSALESSPDYDNDISSSQQFKSLESFDEEKADAYNLGSLLYLLVTGEEFSMDKCETDESKSSQYIIIKTYFPRPLSGFTLKILEGTLQTSTYKRITLFELLNKFDVKNLYTAYKPIQIDEVDKSQKVHLTEYKRALKRTKSTFKTKNIGTFSFSSNRIKCNLMNNAETNTPLKEYDARTSFYEPSPEYSPPVPQNPEKEKKTSFIEGLLGFTLVGAIVLYTILKIV